MGRTGRAIVDLVYQVKEEGPVARQVLGDYSTQAAGLFENVRGTAAFVAGAVAPLGFFAAPQLTKDDSPATVRKKRAHYLLATATLSCLLVAVVYATIAVNKLAETPPRPAANVVQLLARDYELSWVGCNVHFLMGLLGFAAMLVTFAQISFGPAGQVASCMVSSSLLLMVSIVNAGVAQGDGVVGGHRFGGNLLQLIILYLRLLCHNAVKTHSILQVTSLALGVASALLAARLLLSKRASAEGIM